MTHDNAENYAAKHPDKIGYNPQIAEAVKKKTSGKKITCADAHKIAENFNVSPGKTGINIDLLGIRLNKCQLGLFGYAEQGKMIKPAENISKKLEKTIKESTVDGRISCAACWDAAIKNNCSKLDAACASEALGIKISSCQLGAF